MIQILVNDNASAIYSIFVVLVAPGSYPGTIIRHAHGIAPLEILTKLLPFVGFGLLKHH